MEMFTQTKQKDDAKMRGQARFFQLLHAGLNSAALRCALKLDIAGIINRHDGPVTLSQIAQGIGSPSVNVDGLARLMRFMVHKQMFDEVPQPGHKEPLYSLNECSRFLLHDTEDTLAPIAMSFIDPLTFSPYYNLNQAIEEGGTAASKAYNGVEFYDLLSSKPEANKRFHAAMACRTRMEMDAIMSTYDFGSLKGRLVDVGGGIGVTISRIVKAYPHLKGINFDLPHVVSSAPSYEGVTHVGGDMFASIPRADSYLIKATLHNWSDDKCIQVLRNCCESMTKGNGKVIIVDNILNPGGDDVFDDVRIDLDVIMLTLFGGGKERTEVDWKRILEGGGFPSYKIIKMPTTKSIIEAYTE